MSSETLPAARLSAIVAADAAGYSRLMAIDDRLTITCWTPPGMWCPMPDATRPADGGGTLDEWAVLDSLALLVDRSLAVALTPDDLAEPRYRLLDTPSPA